MKYGFIVIALFILCLNTNAQDWVKLMEEGKNLYEIEAEFELQWQGREYQKGEGFKQFQRWKQFWEPRLYPTGSFEGIEVNYLEEYQQSKSKENHTRNFGDWTSLGYESYEVSSYSPGNGRVNTAYISTTSDVMWIGSPSGGAWKSEDNGETYSPMTDQIPTLGVSGIVVDPNNENIVYIGTGDSDGLDTYGVGVLKSLDGGETWNTTGLSFDLGDQIRCNKMIMDPEDANIVFCATNSGLYRTSNAGFSWDYLYNGNVRDIEFKPDNSSVVYITKEKLYKSVNGGDTFSEMSDGLPGTNSVSRLAVAVSEADPEVVYLLYANNVNSYYGLFRSNDAGETWDLQSDSPNILTVNFDGGGSTTGGQAWYDMVLAVSHDDVDDVYVGGINLWGSEDGGVSWDIIAYWQLDEDLDVEYVHADLHYLEFIGDELYCGSDGGIFRSTDYGTSFEDISSGLVISQFYRLGVYSEDSSLLLGGTQDNGTNRLNSSVWTHVFGADGFDAIIKPENPDVMFCCFQYGGIRKSLDGGNSWDPSNEGITESGAWSLPYIMSPINSNTLYAGYENVWRSVNTGNSWVQISDFDNEQLRSIAMGMSDPNTIYTASYDNIYITTDGGGEWNSIDSGLPGQSISYIAVDPLNAQRVWITFSGFNSAQKVYYSENGGTDWQNITDNLPNVPVNCIAYDTNAESIYVGTDNGVFYTDETLAHWELFSTGLPKVIVSELEIHQLDQKVFAATFGRGIWSTEVWSAPESAPVVDFDSEKKIICVGDFIEFTDQSSLNSPLWNWSFEGGEPNISSEENPVITYNSPGVYEVSLTVENEFGETSATYQDFIYVYDLNPEALPVIEGFEDSDDLSELGWFIHDDIEGIHWDITSEGAASGDKSMWVNNYELNIQNEYEVISEPFDLSEEIADAFNYYFSFKYAYSSVNGEEADRLRVYVSNDCGESWVLKGDWSSSNNLNSFGQSDDQLFPASSDFEEVNVELTDGNVGENTMFKFWFRNDNGSDIYIDDINIWNGIVGVEEYANSSNLIVFPNPSDGIIEIKFKDNKVHTYDFLLLDATGKVVLNESRNGTKSTLDLSSFAGGIYFYSIQEKGREETKTGKLILK